LSLDLYRSQTCDDRVESIDRAERDGWRRGPTETVGHGNLEKAPDRSHEAKRLNSLALIDLSAPNGILDAKSEANSRGFLGIDPADRSKSNRGQGTVAFNRFYWSPGKFWADGKRAIDQSQAVSMNQRASS
jgi:hypothetical protein